MVRPIFHAALLTQTYLYIFVGKLPSVGTAGTVTVCANDGTPCPGTFSKTIKVETCGKSDYIFNLKRTDSSSEAYCIGLLCFAILECISCIITSALSLYCICMSNMTFFVTMYILNDLRRYIVLILSVHTVRVPATFFP